MKYFFETIIVKRNCKITGEPLDDKSCFLCLILYENYVLNSMFKSGKFNN